VKCITESNYAELIGKQRIEIDRLQKEIENNATKTFNVFTLLYNIGAPLNDNKLKFNKEQLLYLIEIKDALDL